MQQSLSHHQITNTVRWIITITVMLTAVIEVLDMTIVNVALNQMMGSFAATADQITWVMTAYIVASAVMMPLTGRLVQLFGRRRLLLINISGFFLTSVLCGISTDLLEIVIFRLLQGVFGAALVPLSQYILRDIFPKKDLGKAMAIWGLGIMVAPVLGPTIGGYLTEHFNWRWVFYINVPVCIIAFLLTLSYIPETVRSRPKIDWLGLLLMIAGIGCLQTFLDRGNQEDWLNSNFILILVIITIISLSVFTIRGLIKADNIVKIRLFAERNFLISTLMLAGFSLGLFGMIALQPMMLEQLMGYPSETAGLAMAPRGIASAIAMVLVGPIARKFDPRILSAIGVSCAAFGTYQMMNYSLNDGMWQIIMPTIWQGFGIGFVMVPLSAVAFDYIDQNDVAEASGLFSFGRSLGMSIGISILSSIVTNQTQRSWSSLSSNISLTNQNYLNWAHNQGYDPNASTTLQQAMQVVHQQANLIGFLDAFKIGFIIMILMLCMSPLLKKKIDLTEDN